MDAQVQKMEIEVELSKTQIVKLNEEIHSLKRQNSWRGQLLQYTAIFTVLATLFGIWQGIERYRSEQEADRQAKIAETRAKERENEIREKERIQHVDDTYQAEIQRLSSFAIDPTQTVPSAILTLKEAERILNENGQLSDIEDRKAKLGYLVYYVVAQTDFNLSNPRNASFDGEAITHSDSYKAYLRKDPVANMRVISKYKSTIASLYGKNPRLYGSLRIGENGEYTHDRCTPEQELELYPIIDILDAYKEHTNLFKEAIKEYPNKADLLNKFFSHSICNFYDSFNNRYLAMQFFELTEQDFQKTLEDCKNK